MERAQALKIVFVMILFAIINIFANIAISHAESVYNFYFNPDEKPGANVNPSQPSGPISQDEPSPIRPRELAPSSSYLPKENVKWGDERKLWKLSGAFSQIGLAANPATAPDKFGGSLALKFFPSRFLGLFGEGIYFNQTKGSDITFATGMEIIPIHIDLFAFDDLVELGGELGWSNFHKVGFANKSLMMEWFAGPKLSLNISKDLSIDAGGRFSLSKSKMAYLSAGMSFKF